MRATERVRGGDGAVDAARLGQTRRRELRRGPRLLRRLRACWKAEADGERNFEEEDDRGAALRKHGAAAASASHVRPSTSPAQVFMSPGLLGAVVFADRRRRRRAGAAATSPAEWKELDAQAVALCRPRWSGETRLVPETLIALSAYDGPPRPARGSAFRAARDLLARRVPKRIDTKLSVDQTDELVVTAAILEALAGREEPDADLLRTLKPGFADVGIELGDVRQFGDLRLTARNAVYVHVVSAVRNLLRAPRLSRPIRAGERIVDWMRALSKAPILAPAVPKPANNARPLEAALKIVAAMLAAKNGPTAAADTAKRQETNLRDGGHDAAADFIRAPSTNQASKECELVAAASMAVLKRLLKDRDVTITSDAGSQSIAGVAHHFHAFRMLAVVPTEAAPAWRLSAWAKRAAAAQERDSRRLAPGLFVPGDAPPGDLSGYNAYVRATAGSAHQAVADGPDKFGEASRSVGERWKALGPIGQRPYDDEARDENVDRLKARADYAHASVLWGASQGALPEARALMAQPYRPGLPQTVTAGGLFASAFPIDKGTIAAHFAAAGKSWDELDPTTREDFEDAASDRNRALAAATARATLVPARLADLGADRDAWAAIAARAGVPALPTAEAVRAEPRSLPDALNESLKRLNSM